MLEMLVDSVSVISLIAIIAYIFSAAIVGNADKSQ